ncbi:MAG: hypothetical protein IPP28_04480 [Xanthomonadales bacterium]|nr:hypothetical protein [Xanthomonadales bacterium]
MAGSPSPEACLRQNNFTPNNKTRRRWLPNLHEPPLSGSPPKNHGIEAQGLDQMRTIDKNGIDAVLADLRARGGKGLRRTEPRHRSAKIP